jgi:hypothetical protein
LVQKREAQKLDCLRLPSSTAGFSVAAVLLRRPWRLSLYSKGLRNFSASGAGATVSMIIMSSRVSGTPEFPDGSLDARFRGHDTVRREK